MRSVRGHVAIAGVGETPVGQVPGVQRVSLIERPL
jgi:hypothetical protein